MPRTLDSAWRVSRCDVPFVSPAVTGGHPDEDPLAHDADETAPAVPRVLVVDDDPAIVGMLQRALARGGLHVDTAGSAVEALERVDQRSYDAAVLDLVMPGRDGADLASELRLRLPGLPIALLTGYTQSPLLAGAERSGTRVFAKPVVLHELVDFLKSEIG